jgi:type I restriction enzyme R subunit
VNFVDKSHFIVFDCFDGTLLEFFKQATGITSEPPDKPSRTIAEIIKDIWQNRDRKYNIRCLAKRLQRIDKEMSGDARDLFAHYIPDGDIAKFAKELPESLENNFKKTIDLLRNKDFQDLLVNYPRTPRVFIKAYETEDTVSSKWLIRDGTGKEYRPEDYISAFMQYVQENSNKIDAISVLLERPQNWNTNVLTELKNKLTAAPERFNVENLQKAHEHQYHKALVDIISMVKHACDEQKPLYTAEERVNHAIDIVTKGMSFKEEQLKWLDRIRLHLITSLSIDSTDFDIIPILKNAGGWGRANKVFKGELPYLLNRFNEAIAA